MSDLRRWAVLVIPAALVGLGLLARKYSARVVDYRGDRRLALVYDGCEPSRRPVERLARVADRPMERLAATRMPFDVADLLDDDDDGAGRGPGPMAP